MTFREAFQTANAWQRRIVIVSLYHNARLSQNKKWKVSDTAHYFQISIGHASENITLAHHFEEIKECSSRNVALKQLRK